MFQCGMRMTFLSEEQTNGKEGLLSDSAALELCGLPSGIPEPALRNKCYLHLGNYTFKINYYDLPYHIRAFPSRGV